MRCTWFIVPRPQEWQSTCPTTLPDQVWTPSFPRPRTLHNHFVSIFVTLLAWVRPHCRGKIPIFPNSVDVVIDDGLKTRHSPCRTWTQYLNWTCLRCVKASSCNSEVHRNLGQSCGMELHLDICQTLDLYNLPRNMNCCFQSLDIEAKVPFTKPWQSPNKESNLVLVKTNTRGKSSTVSKVTVSGAGDPVVQYLIPNK